MAGRPPTPPNDEEMEDADHPIGAGAGPVAPNIENQKADVKAFVKDTLKKIRSIPYGQSIQSIKGAVQELIDDEELKKFIPEGYGQFKREIEGIFANNDAGGVLFKREVRDVAGTLENLLITEAMNSGLGLGVMELYGRGPFGGKRRKTRKNKKSLRKSANVRKTRRR